MILYIKLLSVSQTTKSKIRYTLSIWKILARKYAPDKSEYEWFKKFHRHPFVQIYARLDFDDLDVKQNYLSAKYLQL